MTVSALAVSPALAADFTLGGSALSIAAGATVSTGTVTITAVDNDVAAPGKTVTVSATTDNSQGVTAPSGQTLSITDDDIASTRVTLTVAPDEVNEDGGAVTLTVTGTLDAGTRATATVVTLAVSAGTATVTDDYSATGAALTITAGRSSASAALTVTPVNDAVAEGPETVSVEGSTAVSGLTVTAATVTLVDDEGTPTVTLALTPDLINENGGVSTVTAALSHASSEDTTVTVSAAPVAPALAGDFRLNGATLSIAAGATSSSGAVTITAVDNDVDAPGKTVTVKGAASNNLGVSGPADLSLSITDDDARGVTVSKTRLSIDEGEDGTYTVVLDSEPAGPVTVTPGRRSGDSGVSVSGALSFTADNWDMPRTVTVSAGQDTDAVDDTALIGHTVSGADYGSVTAVSVTVTVNDDETVSTRVTLSVSPDTLSEGAGAATVTVTARLNSGTRGSDTPVAVTVGSGTAASGTDFATVSGFTITIGANQVSGSGTFRLTPTDDSTDEPDETVAIGGSAKRLTVTPATLTIEDNDDAPTVTLVLTPASIRESDDPEQSGDQHVSTITAVLDHASSAAATVTVSAKAALPEKEEDFLLSANRTLTVAAGATTSSGTVTLSAVDNTIDAPSYTVTVSATAANRQGITAPQEQTLTIIDDDDAPTVTLVLTPVSIRESDDPEQSGDQHVSTVTATLDHASSETAAATVTVAVAGEGGRLPSEREQNPDCCRGCDHQQRDGDPQRGGQHRRCPQQDSHGLGDSRQPPGDNSAAGADPDHH